MFNSFQLLIEFGSENELNMYLNHMIHSSIPTEDKNSTREWSREDCEVQTGLPIKYVEKGSELLHKSTMLYHLI
jgi:NADH:ubiquinone oxidoreductase subunit